MISDLTLCDDDDDDDDGNGDGEGGSGDEMMAMVVMMMMMMMTGANRPECKILELPPYSLFCFVSERV